MANTFTHKKKLELLATAVRDNMPYVMASEQKFPQSEMKGKKYGASVHMYLADPGTVKDGMVADPDTITEVELTGYMQNKNTSVETDLWEDFNDIESFSKAILKPRGLKLAREVEDDVIKHNVYRGLQAVVKTTADFGLLSDAATALTELSVVGTIVDFQSPTIFGKIANGGLAKYIPDAIQADIYKKLYLGEYAGASCVQQALMPKVKMPSTMDTAPTITFTAITETINGVSTVVGYTLGAVTKSDNAKTLDEGAAYKIPGLKIVDESGMETNQDVVVVLHKKITGVNTTGPNKGVLSESLGIEDLRVTVKGYGTGNPNAWVDSSFDATNPIALQPLLTAGKTYAVGQVRTEDSLCFDSYSFSDLPSSRQENVGVDGPITLKCSEFGEGKKGVQMTRIDAPFMAKIWEPRRCVVTFVQLD